MGADVVAAVIQGNVPRLGLDFNSQREAVLRNHVEGTLTLAADVADGTQPQPDLVIWPENASDVDPLRDQAAAALIQGAVDAIAAPVLVGAVVDNPADPSTILNVGIVWEPTTASDAGGPSEVYVKRHPVPFGEYIPFRSWLRLVSDEVDRVPRDFAAGDRAGVLQMGPARVGDVICFEVAYDGLVRSTVVEGAQLLIVQTNNATFGRTPQTEQQLAMSRLRAVEHGRWVLVAATVGVSATIAPDGTVEQRAEIFTQAQLVQAVRLSDDADARRPAGRPARGRDRADRFRRRCLVGYRHLASSPAETRRHRPLTTTRPRRSDRLPRLRRPGRHPHLRRGGPTSSASSSRVRTSVPDAHVLVADDNSPDGTGEIADRLAAADDHVHVLHRAGKQGLGAAYLDAFDWALDRRVRRRRRDGRRRLAPPEQLPRLLDAVDAGADLVLGSRWVAGGRVVNWPRSREVLSRGGNTYARLALGLPLHDATGGYRAFRAATLKGLDLDSVASQGYCFQVDLARRAVELGFTRRRGADHVRRARGGRQQDEPGHRR